MMRLTGNELYKLFRTRKPYVFAAIVIIILVLNLHNYTPGDPMVAWTFRHGQSVPLNTLDLLTQFMIIFLPILLGDSVTNEYRRGTLKLPLLRPVHRSELLAAKLASMLVFIVILAAFYVAAAYALGAHYLGWGDGTEYAGRVVSAAEGFRLTLAAVALLIFPFTVYGLFVSAVAVLAGSMSLAVIVALVIMTIALNLNTIEAVAPWSLAYLIGSYHEAFISGPDWKPALRQTGVLTGYAAIFAFLSFRIFGKKEILF
jgi:ABC-type transport system involved in multi-copper enzyme maturation permease subunit